MKYVSISIKRSICFLVGHFTSLCSSDNSSGTEWSHKEACYCEKEALLQEFRLKVCTVCVNSVRRKEITNRQEPTPLLDDVTFYN